MKSDLVLMKTSVLCSVSFSCAPLQLLCSQANLNLLQCSCNNEQLYEKDLLKSSSVCKSTSDCPICSILRVINSEGGSFVHINKL